MSDEVTAIHGVSDEGEHIVGIGNLRVLIEKEGEFWFAQGLEIDYVSQGDTVEDAKMEFESGLAGTIHVNLKINKKIESILNPAPPEVWNRFLTSSSKKIPYTFTQISVHDIKTMPYFPFEGIGYFQEEGWEESA